VRVDAGFQTGDDIPPHYDSLIAKVIVFASNRAGALARMDSALARYVVLGPTTNIPFLRAVLAHPEFQGGAATTRFIETHFADWRSPANRDDEALIAAALAEVLASPATHDGSRQVGEADNPWTRADGFRMGREG
jgi:acetyl/propionyl-CoA carboxylase alpha subunit